MKKIIVKQMPCVLPALNERDIPISLLNFEN